MKQIDLREGARRQHRAVSLFAVIQCWLRGLDGVVFDRAQLERLLGLARFKRTRVSWIEEDLREFFPHQKLFWYQGGSFASIFASRLPLVDYLPSGKMSDDERIAGIPQEGPKLAAFEMWAQPQKAAFWSAINGAAPFLADSMNWDERLLSAYLSLLSQGQIAPRSLPSLRSAGR